MGFRVYGLGHRKRCLQRPTSFVFPVGILPDAFALRGSKLLITLLYP